MDVKSKKWRNDPSTGGVSCQYVQYSSVGKTRQQNELNQTQTHQAKI